MAENVLNKKPQEEKSTLEILHEEKIYLTADKEDIQEKKRRFNVMAWILPVLCIAVGWWIYTTGEYLFLAVPILYAIMPFAIIQTYRSRIKQIENDIEDLDFEIDMEKSKATKHEQRAEKLLWKNDLQLRRYYDLNLGQNKWVFGLGIFCIVLGIVIIVVSLLLVINVAKTMETKIITAALGAVGAILSDYIAVIYLKMNTSATENLKAFHSRLVETQQFLLSNLFASRIDDRIKRENTLSKLSVCLMQQEKTEEEKPNEEEIKKKKEKRESTHKRY